MTRWTAERRAKFSGTIARRHDPLKLAQCQTCPSTLTGGDTAAGCVRCKKCRRGGLHLALPKLSHVEPEAPTESWWLRHQTRASQDEWFELAKAQVTRMSKSKEAKSMGLRKSVDELFGSARGRRGES